MRPEERERKNAASFANLIYRTVDRCVTAVLGIPVYGGKGIPPDVKISDQQWKCLFTRVDKYNKLATATGHATFIPRQKDHTGKEYWDIWTMKNHVIIRKANE